MSQLLPSWHFSTLFLVVGRLIQPDSIFCVTQSHNCRVWKGPTPAKAVSYSRLHWKALRQLLNIPREGDTTTSLGNLFQCSTTLKVKKLFLMFRWNFPFPICPHCPWLHYWALLQRTWLHPLDFHPLDIFKGWFWKVLGNVIH